MGEGSWEHHPQADSVLRFSEVHQALKFPGVEVLHTELSLQRQRGAPVAAWQAEKNLAAPVAAKGPWIFMRGRTKTVASPAPRSSSVPERDDLGMTHTPGI